MHRNSAAPFVLAALAAFALASTAQAADQAQVLPLINQELGDIDNKEVVMLTVEYAPGQSSPPHRHNAHTFVYVLEGAVVMGVEGKEPIRLAAGQTFYESPTDVHTVSRNASTSAAAKFLVFFIRDKGAATMAPAE